MDEKGMFHPEDRVELIGGEIYDMSPIGSLHARCVKFLSNFLIQTLSGSVIVGVQDPIILDDLSEPQPDISILDYRADFYKEVTPNADNVRLLMEVADTSADFDRKLKLRRYASAGIPETWLVDLASDRVELHTQPAENGYKLVRAYQRGETIASEAIPAIELSVDDILG